MRRRTFVGGVFAGLAATALGAKPETPKKGDVLQRTSAKAEEQSTVASQAGSRGPLLSSKKGKAITLAGAPALTLDDLATAWLPRRITEPAGMPGLNNDIGAIQVEADVAAIKHPVFPPYSGGNEITGITLLNDRQLAQVVPHVEVRWRAFEIERRCESNGWRLESRTALLPEQPGVLVRVKITNTLDRGRKLKLGFLCSGRSVNTGNEGYAWAVPTIPTDVSSFTQTKGLGQTVTATDIPDSRCFTNDQANGHCVHSVWPAPSRWERERIPVWETEVRPGKSFVVHLLCSFHAERAQAEQIARQWYRQDEKLFVAARGRWEGLWKAAFTPGNSLFSGHMPWLDSPHDALNRLYYNGVLTILTCRRMYPQAVLKPCYLTLWPRRGEGSVYLPWDLGCTSGVLARLDPRSLREQLLAAASAPWLNCQVTNFFTNRSGGWPCCAHPQSIYTSAFNLLRWAGDESWMSASILRQPKQVQGFEAASQGQVTAAPREEAQKLTGREAWLEAIQVHRQHHLPQKTTVDFGGRGSYLECITTYAHGTAGHTALQAWALREAAALIQEDYAAEVKALEDAVLDLYAPGAGYFQCEYPDQTRYPAANLYDLSLVLNHLGERLPSSVTKEIVQFARAELLTPTWAHCLWPKDLDVLSGVRCDHQWSGSFAAWVPQFVLGVMKAGVGGDWVVDWLEGVARVTRQGPFAQAYWAEDVYPPESGAAPKCYDELPQGNHWVISSGAMFAEMVLDGICGISADLSGKLTLRPGLRPWANECSIANISAHGRNYRLAGGQLKEII